MTADSGLVDTKLDRCPICFGELRLWRVKTTHLADFPIDRCRDCGYALANPRPSLEYLMQFYSAHGHTDGGANETHVADAEAAILREAEHPNSTLDAKRIVGTMRSILGDRAGGRLLDVGSGYGFYSREAQRAGFDVTAIELAENERLITESIAGVTPLAIPFEEYQLAGDDYSAVLMSQILEHALDVELWVRKANELLRTGGVLGIAVPNFGSIFRKTMQHREPFICPPAHLNFFSPKNLKKLLERCGFRVRKTQWISRIPASAFRRRLPGPTKLATPVAHALCRATLRAFDLLHGGQIINVYAEKVAPHPVSTD